MRIGRRIYFDVLNGDVLVDTGEKSGDVFRLTVEQEINIYKALKSRVRDSFDFLELEFGQNAQDFAESNGYWVNPETKTLEFSYPDPTEPEVEQPYQAPLSAEVERLKQEDLNNKEAIAELYILSMGGF